ncbi:MAG: hypothetical protein ACXVQR_05220 [Solirubrobacteraceae bacterium]
MTPFPARLAGAALIALAAVPATASAATLQLNRQCYTKNQLVRVSGAGYQPKQALTLFLNGKALVSGTSDAAGRLAGRFNAPAPFRSVTSTRTYSVSISPSPTGSPVSARGTFKVVHTNIGVIPPFITPGFVTYTALGFTYGRSLYVHYLRGTRHLHTKRIGALAGPCGSLKKKIKMFLFRPVKPGSYTLVFDNSSRYSATYRPNFSFQALVPYTFT